MVLEASPTGNIHERLIRAMEAVGAIGKNKKVNAPGMNYAFRGIDDLMNATHPVFIEHGITVMPRVLDVKQSLREVTNDYGKTVEYERILLTMEYTFTAPDGSSCSASVIGCGLDSSDKAGAKATSMALKYALIQALDIPTEDIEDGDSTRPTVESSRAPSAPPKNAQEPTNGKAGHLAEAAKEMGLKERMNGDPWAELSAAMRERKLSSGDIKAVLGTFNANALTDWLNDEDGRTVDALVQAVLSTKAAA